MKLSANEKDDDLFSRTCVIFESVSIHVRLQRLIFDLLNLVANNLHAQKIFRAFDRLLKLLQHFIHDFSHDDCQRFLIDDKRFHEIH